MKDNKKVIVPTLIAVVTLLLLVVGATYAYIQVTATNSFGTPKITGTVPSIGSVTITKGSDLTLALTRTQVMKPASNQTYYATASGASTTESSPAIATATVTGQGTFTCTYSITVTASGALFTNSIGKGANLIKLTVNGGTNGATATTHDFNTAWSNKTVTGSLTGLTSSNSGSITAQLYYVNSTTVDQSNLNGTTGTVTFSMTSFDCTATA